MGCSAVLGCPGSWQGMLTSADVLCIQDREIIIFQKDAKYQFVYSLLDISGAFTSDGTAFTFLSNALQKQALELE